MSTSWKLCVDIVQIETLKQLVEKIYNGKKLRCGK